jgi:hypothetical protein
MTLRSDIHAALDSVTPAAPHLPTLVVDAVLAAPPPRRHRLRAASLTAAGLVGIIVVAILAVSIRSSIAPGTASRPPQASSPLAALVITTWVRDPSVVGGPQPGYRPQISMINRGTLTSVSAARDPTGNDWVVAFTLGPEDARGFELLTAGAVAACPGDCPERHLATWLDLTQDDVDHWSERGNVLSRRVSEGGKLLSDPYVVSPITSGRAYIQGRFSQQEATVLARRLGGK